MERSPFFKPIAKINALIILAQSITWFILSIICFLYYSAAVTFEPETKVTYKGELQRVMYDLYLNQNSKLATGGLNITSKEFMVFCSFYFVISIVLINTSIVALYSMRKVNEKAISFWQYCSLITWILVSSLQSLLDLVFFCLLLDDYNYFANQEVSVEGIGIHSTCVGIVMTIISRGFLLWIINLFLNVLTMMMIIREYQKDRDQRKELFPALERRSTIRRSVILSDDLRSYPSSDGYVADRFDPYANQTSTPPPVLHRPPSVARFNPPPPPPSSRYDNGYGGSDQNRPYNGGNAGGLRRSDSGRYGGR